MPVPRCDKCGRVLPINGKCENGCTKNDKTKPLNPKLQ